MIRERRLTHPRIYAFYQTHGMHSNQKGQNQSQALQLEFMQSKLDKTTKSIG
jgi:hypothetical protein